MPREVKLNELATELEDLPYPVTREQVLSDLSEIVLTYADGQEPLPDVVSRSTADVYHDPEDLKAEIYNNLPTEAVGEPGQSEGEG